MFFRHQRLIKNACAVLSNHDWLGLIRLMKQGLSPNQSLPMDLVSHLSRFKDKGATTTPFLFLSNMRMEAPSELFQAFQVALQQGADPLVVGHRDVRTAWDHLGNTRSLDGWKLMAQYHTPDHAKLLEIARNLDWPEGERWAVEHHAATQFQGLDQTTPSPPSRPLRRF